MGLTVTRVRFEETGDFDRWGKPITRRIEEELRAFAFAPQVTGEVNGVEQLISRTGGTLYFRAPNTPSVSADEQFIVRGVSYQADGPDAYWEHPSGRSRGTVVVLRRSEAIGGS